MQKVIIIFLWTTFVGCSNKQTNTVSNKAANMDTTTYTVQPLQIDNGEEEGWGADIRLSIAEKFENDTARIYRAVSTYKEQELGLLVSVPKHKEGDKGFSQGISLQSIGPRSDFLLQTLSHLYKQKESKVAMFTKAISVSYVNLKEFAKSISGQEEQYTSVSEYKLFFEGKTDEDYAEIYLNINPTDNWIELREKDEEYRPVLLRHLRQ